MGNWLRRSICSKRVGLYPPTAEAWAKPENSLAYTLLKRMGLPTDAVICEKGPMGFDDKRIETGDAGGEQSWSRFWWRKRKGINSRTNARVKAKARLGDREDAEDTVE